LPEFSQASHPASDRAATRKAAPQTHQRPLKREEWGVSFTKNDAVLSNLLFINNPQNKKLRQPFTAGIFDNLSYQTNSDGNSVARFAARPTVTGYSSASTGITEPF
jgi:hypothetical protein